MINNTETDLSNSQLLPFDVKKLVIDRGQRSEEEMKSAIILAGIPVIKIMQTESSPDQLHIVLAVSESDWLSTGGKDAYMARIERALIKMDTFSATHPHAKLTLKTESNPNTLMVTSADRASSAETYLYPSLLGGTWAAKRAGDGKEYCIFKPDITAYKNAASKYRHNGSNYDYIGIKKSSSSSDATVSEITAKLDEDRLSRALQFAEIEPEKIAYEKTLRHGMGRIQGALKKYIPRLQTGVVGRHSTGQKYFYLSLPGPSNVDEAEKLAEADKSAGYIRDLLCARFDIAADQCEIKPINKDRDNRGVALTISQQALATAGKTPSSTGIDEAALAMSLKLIEASPEKTANQKLLRLGMERLETLLHTILPAEQTKLGVVTRKSTGEKSLYIVLKGATGSLPDETRAHTEEAAQHIHKQLCTKLRLVEDGCKIEKTSQDQGRAITISSQNLILVGEQVLNESRGVTRPVAASSDSSIHEPSKAILPFTHRIAQAAAASAGELAVG